MAAIPTLAVYDPNKDPKHEMIPADPKDAQRLHKFDYALQNVKMLHDAGVNIAVGTDAGMPATPHGSSTLHELELLVKAGLTPAQAIAAATSVSAKVIGQDDDRGTIAVAKRADLDLFDGKPWENIAAVHTLAMTMIDGKSVWGLNAPSLPAANAATYLEPVTAMALIDDFESENGRSSLDTLRVDTPDGGLDRTTEISEVVARDGDGHALLISAKMAMKKDAYAGVAVPLTRGSIRPADVHAFHGVRLEARGNACSDRLTLSGVSGGSWSAPLPVSTEWKTLEIPFAALASPSPRRTKPWTGTDVTQVEFGGSCKGGQKLFLQVDNVTFY